jgi:hypothetical protein
MCAGIRLDAMTFTLSTLLLDSGLPDEPALLIEPHRNHRGIWRIKFCYDELDPLSMNAEQASILAARLHQIGEDAMASEIDEAVGRAKHYESM